MSLFAATAFSALALASAFPVSPTSEYPVTDRLMSELTLEQKAGQMTQLTVQLVATYEDGHVVLNERLARQLICEYHIGSWLDNPTSQQSSGLLSAAEWADLVADLQEIALDCGEPPIVYGLDSVHGANYVRGAVIFPQQINAAASMNRELTEAMGRVTAKDTRAAGIPWTFAPILGIATSPSWPRVYETFGEDPFVASEMGVALINGLQGDDLACDTCVAACMKHFIGYSAPHSGYDRMPAYLPDRVLLDYYAPSFIAANDVAHVATAMESYHDINGEPVVSSEKYLRKLLRDDMGFEGMLVTDYAEVTSMFTRHKVATDLRDAARITMQKTSIDMNMEPFTPFYASSLVDLVNDGVVDMARIDESARRVLVLKEQLGLFDHPVPDRDNPLIPTVGSDADREVALNLARESIVLLRNDNDVLPLTHASNVLVTGPAADSLRVLTGGWSIHWQGAHDDDEFTYGTTIVEGLREVLSDSTVEYSPGCGLTGPCGPELAEAVSAASQADVAVVCVGEGPYAEKNGDIDDLDLPEGQRALIRAIEETGTPVVVVLVEGRMRLLRGSVSDVDSVVHALLPGPDGGLAVAEVLAGIVNPSGKLPVTYPKTNAGSSLRYYHKASEAEDFDPEWTFGHGLSYTTFAYSGLSVSADNICTETSTVAVSVNVANTGARAGKEVVMIYVTDEVRSTSPEVKMLHAFEKIELSPGESRVLEFSLPMRAFAFHGLDDTFGVEEGRFTIRAGPLEETFRLNLEGKETFMPLSHRRND
eukprot:Rmarinus@m.26209